MNKSTKLYILYGGPSSEREVSFSSKKYFEKLYSEYSPILVEWLKDFRFSVLGDAIYSEDEFYKKLSVEDCVVILAGHGEYIEDGYLQERLSLYQISFTGSNSSSCMLSMDKYETFEALKRIIFTHPVYKTKVKHFSYDSLIEYVGENYPLFVKPNGLGSSLGVRKVKSKNELLRTLRNYKDEDILFQHEFCGMEVSQGVVKINSGFMRLPSTQVTTMNEFFDYAAKYSKGMSDEITPAKLPKKILSKVEKLSIKIHETLGLGFYSRSDFIVSPKGKIYYLETNSLPGMTETSLLPQQVKFAGKTNVFKKQLLTQTVPMIKNKKILLDVPYFSQFTLPENNDLARDNKWLNVKKGFKNSGARTISEYVSESSNLCGTACLKMAFSYFHKREERLFEIYYNLLKEHYVEIGLDYRNIQSFLNPYKLRSKVYRTGLTVDQICFHLSKKELPIVSVGTLNTSKNSTQKKSGHLVLVTGYDLKKKSFYINDPSGSLVQETQKNRELSFDLFRELYSYKGFVISNREI